MMPPDPGGVTAGDAVTPEQPMPTEHLAEVSVYRMIETACRNYQQAARHLSVGFDSTNASTQQIEIGVGVELIASGANFTRLVGSELERNWGLKSSSTTSAPSAATGRQNKPPQPSQSKTPLSGAFVTPSRNIACGYRGDGQSVGEIWCYVRSSRTLAVVNESGAGRAAYVRSGVQQPSELASLDGPILDDGAKWTSPFGGTIKCVSQTARLTCVNVNGNYDTGFVASREQTRTLSGSGTQTRTSPEPATAPAAPNRDSQEPTQPPAAPETGTPRSDALPLTVFSGRYFAIDYPTGWRIENAETKVSYGFDTTIRDPDAPTTTYVRVDYTPNARIKNAREAAAPQHASGSTRPGYREIAFSDTTFAGYDAVQWEFEALVGDTLVHKVDIFLLDAHGTGIGVLTQAPASRWGSWEPTFTRMYSTFALR